MPSINDTSGRPRGLAARMASTLTWRRVRWLVVASWLAALAVLAPLTDVESVERNDAAAVLPRDADSRAVAALQKRFGHGDVQPAVVVYHRSSGLTAADLERIELERQALGERLGTAPGPVQPSEDGRAALYAIPLDFSGDADPLGAVRTIRETVTERDDGLEAMVTGPAGFTTDLVAVFDGLDTTLLLGSVLVVAVLLLLTYRSPFLWLLPLVTVGFAHAGAMAVVYLLARDAGLTVTGLSGGVLPVLVFGVGTDYAFLLIARYREELRRLEDTGEAMRRALRRAMPAIAASSSTCVAGLLCLMVAGSDQVRGLGPIGAVGILSALVTMLTLLPALLLLCGRRVFWPFIPEVGSSGSAGGPWDAIGERIARRPRTIWIGTVALLGVLALGLLGLDTRLVLADQFRDEPESIAGQRLIAASYVAGASAPATVIGDRTAGAAIEGVLAGAPSVAGFSRSGATADLVAFEVTLEATPGSDDAFAAIADLRERLGALPGAEALVGGPDAETLDLEAGFSKDLGRVVPLVLLVVLAILGLLLRSVVAPLLLTGTVLLSFAAALGASVLVFQHLFGFAAVEPSIPLLGFVFLVALGIDYNIFLVSRVQEEAATVDTRRAMIRGLGATGGVITSAGLVLAATFSVLTVLPLVMMVQLGFVVAFGVLLDAMLVRSVLVPAIVLHLGERTWWPLRASRLDRRAARQSAGRAVRPGVVSNPDGATPSTASRSRR